MGFFEDLWKKLKSTVHSTEDPAELIKAYQQLNDEEQNHEEQQSNIEHIRSLEPTEYPEELRSRFDILNKHMGTSEAYETFRQERWYPKIQCPKCDSHFLKRLTQRPGETAHNHRYRCLECHFEFNDDDELPTDQEIPPLNIWMQCWYLMGCSDSLSYIASVLNLELGVVEFMAEQLRRIFNANAPLSKDLSFEEWEEQALELRKQLQAELAKKLELLDANITAVPKDTTEFRRQQNLRRNLSASTEAPKTPKRRQ